MIAWCLSNPPASRRRVRPALHPRADGYLTDKWHPALSFFGCCGLGGPVFAYDERTAELS